MRSPRCAALGLAVALSPLGTIAGHVAGYGVAGDGLGAGHAHLRPAAAVAALAAAAALAWVATSRRAGGARPPLAWLAGGQALAFVALEAGERAAAGHGVGGLVADPAFLWGLGAQAAVAALLLVAAAIARTTGVRVRAALSCRRRAPAPVPPPSPFATTVSVLRAAPPASPVTERGPPRLPVPV